MRYPLARILNLRYKLHTTINIELLYKSGNTNLNKFPFLNRKGQKFEPDNLISLSKIQVKFAAPHTKISTDDEFKPNQHDRHR